MTWEAPRAVGVGPDGIFGVRVWAWETEATKKKKKAERIRSGWGGFGFCLGRASVRGVHEHDGGRHIDWDACDGDGRAVEEEDRRGRY